MPDIGLAVSFDHDALEPGLAQRFITALSAGRRYSIRHRSEKGVVAVNLLKSFSQNSNQPLECPTGWLMIDGAIYSSRQLADCYQDLISLEPTRVSKVPGQFNAIVYSAASNQVSIVTDRFGLRPIYYRKHNGTHYFSSEIKAIEAVVGSTLGLSPLGLLELYAFGHNTGDRTIFDGVSVLPPGTIIHITPEGVVQNRYYRFKFETTNEHLSVADWGHQLADGLRGSIAKYLNAAGRPCIFLSGGLDSRFLAAAIAEQSSGLSAFTFGDQGRNDVVFGRQLANRLQMPHTVLTYPEAYLSSTVKAIVERTECSAPFFHTSSMIFHDQVAEQADRIFVGFCGDILSGGHLRRSMISAARPTEISEQILNRALLASKSSISNVLQPQLVEDNWTGFLDAFRATVDSIDDDIPANVADTWDMENRQRRFTFPASKVDRARFEVVAPLLDLDFVSTALRMPIERRWHQAAYRTAIVDSFPSIRSVPWAKTGRPIRKNPLAFEFEEFLRKGGILADRAKRRVLKRRATTASGFRDVAKSFRQDSGLLSRSPVGLFDFDALPAEYFNHAGISTMIDQHLEGLDHSHLLGSTLTVMTWRQRMIS